MEPLIELEEVQQSVYRYFGKFPFLLLFIFMLVLYLVLGGKAMVETGDLTGFLSMEVVSNAFFYSVLASAGLFLLGRFTAINSVKKADNLKDLDQEGVYLPLMLYQSLRIMSYGNLIITKDRFYFQPDLEKRKRLFFDYGVKEDFQVVVDESISGYLVYLLTGHKTTLVVQDSQGKGLARFVSLNPKKDQELIEQKLKEVS